MLGGSVGDNTVRRWPAGAKELGEDRLLGREQAAPVLRMRPALLREQETRAGDGCARPRLEGASDVSAVGDAARNQQRILARHGRADSVEQLERWDRSPHMSPGLDTLDDHRVGARRVGGECLIDRAALVDPDTGRAPLRDTPEGDDDVGLRGCREPVAPGEREEDVDGQRLAGQRSRCRELTCDRGGAVDRDRPQPTGLRDRRGELMSAQTAAHPGLDDGELDPKALEKRHAARLREDAGVADPFKLVVLASGTGSNLQAILDRVHMREGIEVVGVGSDKPKAPALERARAARIPAAVFPAEDFADREARDTAMGDWVEERGADLIALAGYMQLLSETFVARFRHRIVNVHPALLPDHPGLDAIGQALDAGAEVTGVTVHFVDEGIDTGPVIVQREVRVPASRDRKELELAIHATEHELYPEAIRMIATGRVRIDADDPRLVVIDE